jgi:hypothetical protein
MAEIVHVIPLGWEIDRAVLATDYYRPTRVHLIWRQPSTGADPNERILAKVKACLRERNIAAVVHEVHPTREFESFLMEAAAAIRKEASAGNRVYVNISAAGKVAAAAGSLAASYHSEKVTEMFYIRPRQYTYAHPDHYREFEEHGLSIGVSGIELLPKLKLFRPTATQELALARLYERKNLTYVGLLHLLAIETDSDFSRLDPELGDAFREGGSELDMASGLPSKFDVKRDVLEKWLAKLRRQIVEPLLQLNYVALSPSRVGAAKFLGLTREGQYAALLTGLIGRLESY